MPADNQPWVYKLCTFRKRLLSVDLHHEKWFLRFCRNQMRMGKGMGLINYWSEVTHGQILLHGTMHLAGLSTKENPRTLLQLHEEWRRGLYTDNQFPEIMILVYWLKVNSSVIIFTDHLWCIPFCDQCFQCNLFSCITAFRIWAWFLVRTVEISESLLNVSTCLSLKSSFNHYQSSLSCCLIKLQIETRSRSQFGTYSICHCVRSSHFRTFLIYCFPTVCSECERTLWLISSLLSTLSLRWTSSLILCHDYLWLLYEFDHCGLFR